LTTSGLERVSRTRRRWSEQTGSAIAFAFGHRTGVLDGADAFAVEDFVEGTAVFAVPAANQEADALVRVVKAEGRGIYRRYSVVR
jgi:hypothetical protein